MKKIDYIEIRISLWNGRGEVELVMDADAYIVIPPMDADTTRTHLYGLVQPLYDAVVNALTRRLAETPIP